MYIKICSESNIKFVPQRFDRRDRCPFVMFVLAKNIDEVRNDLLMFDDIE